MPMVKRRYSYRSLLADAIRTRGGRVAVLKALLRLALRQPALLFRPKALLQHAARDFRYESEGWRGGINLIGHVYAILGRAEDIRTAALACRAAAIPMLIMNRNGGHDVHLQGMHPDFPLFDRVRSAPEYCANVFYLNADEMPLTWDHYGQALFAGRYNIGVFAWELSGFPAAWHDSFQHLDELWAPSRFIQDALDAASDLPVVHMPFVVEPGAPGKYTRSAFGLPDEKFLFLFFFDFRSYQSRKNPGAVLDAFFRAFPASSQDHVHLVIKVNGIEDKQEEFDRFVQDGRIRDPRVQLITRNLDDAGIKSLVALSDCFVSLHRSEGFGRGLAEAMYYEKPVIATAYSGNMDFMNKDNACLVDYAMIPLGENDYPYWQGQHWADPDLEQAAWYMRHLVEDSGRAKEIGRRAGLFIKTNHSSSVVGARQRKRLEKLGLVKRR